MPTLAVAGMPASGHLSPTLPVVRELVARGVRVVYYTGAEFADDVERTGAEFRPYPDGTITAQDIADATRTGSPVQVVTRILRATETLHPFLRAEFERDRPDAVAHDSNALWGRTAAAALGLPRISLMTTVLLGADATRGLTAREWAVMLRAMVPGVPGAFAARLRLGRRIGSGLLPPRPMLPMFGDLTLFPVPRSLQPDNPRLDAGCHFVGAPVDPAVRDTTLDPELAEFISGDDPLVLVSLGTLHTGTAEFFRTCCQALADLPARIVLSVGAHTNPAALGRLPANTLARRTVPQLALLSRAAAFVTHGGMNSVLEALHHGVPLIALPQQVEQYAIARTLAANGAATILRHHLAARPVPAATLRAAVAHPLTNPAPREAATALAAAFPRDAPTAAATLIEKVIR